MLDGTTAHPRKRTTFSLVVPVVSFVGLLAAWYYDRRWLMLPIVALAIAVIFLLPRLVRSREVRFHKQALRLLATGKAAMVPELARRQLVLQLFGTSGPIDAILGLACSQSERWPSAASHLAPAVAVAAGPELAVLRANLTKALFATGDLSRAKDEGMGLLETGLRLPETLALVARSLVGLGTVDDLVSSLLDEAEAGSPSDDVRMMIELTRIEMRLATGRRVPPLADNADSGQRLVRAWIHFVRGRLREHRGDDDGAAASYGKAEREAGEDVPVFSALAHGRLGVLAGSRASAEGTERPVH
jgi:hypothetical protein